VIVKDENLGEIEWVIRSIPAYDLLQHYDLFSSMPQDINLDVDKDGQMSDKQAKVLKEKLLPMMELIVPACAIDPPVTVDLKDPRIAEGEALHLRDISFQAVTDLFAKILDVSGLSKEADEKRKKSAGANSPKQ
tara:strand:+ start:14752 stop:15153 length:402 start_codon:yes stop_codon:yes gene_type:complete